MTQPLSNQQDSGIFRGAHRRFQPGEVQLALQRAKRAAQRQGRNLWQQGGNVWRRGRRNPRALALVGAGLVVTLIGAYTVSASGVGPSLCPAAQRSVPVSKSQKKPDFELLMDRVPQAAAAGSTTTSVASPREPATAAEWWFNSRRRLGPGKRQRGPSRSRSPSRTRLTVRRPAAARRSISRGHARGATRSSSPSPTIRGTSASGCRRFE
jgi:hypothetical protein